MNGRELLTSLLFQCGVDHPDETADALIFRFGSLSALVDAFSLRISDKSLPSSAQTLLGMIPGMCRQRTLDRIGPLPQLNTLERAADYAAALYIGAHHECIRMLCLDERLTLSAQYVMTEGGLKEISFSPRLLLREAITCNAQAVILCHNHPSGRAHFSEADVSATRALLELCAAVNLTLLDHLLIAGNRVLSMRSKLYIPERLWAAANRVMPSSLVWRGVAASNNECGGQS